MPHHFPSLSDNAAPIAPATLQMARSATIDHQAASSALPDPRDICSLVIHRWCRGNNCLLQTLHCQTLPNPRQGIVETRDVCRRLNESRRALYYLATPPALFDPFVDQVDTAELREGTVVVVDSRFGRDLASAHPMDAALRRILDEHLALRVDLPA